jgi:methylthioribose-1-phosphate isomerase
LANTQAKEWILQQLEYLKTSRPTAVNLFNDCNRLAGFVKALDAASADAVLDS